MGYVPAPQPPRLNLDRFGMPRDYATYVWLLYGKHVRDDSPERRAFLGHREDGWQHPTLGQQVMYR